jgi:hypothetical protein
LECFGICLTGQDVVAVSATLHHVFALFGILYLVSLILSQNSESNVLAIVLLLLERPVAVTFVNCHEVVVKVLIDLEVADRQEWEEVPQLHKNPLKYGQYQ